MWIDAYLQTYATAVLQSGVAPPKWAAPYLSNVIVSPLTTFADLNPDVAHQVLISAGWSYTLLALTHQLVASQTVSFTFSGAEAGKIYYGLALYTGASALAWALAFSAPYTVPTGGGTLVVNADQNFSDCQFSS